MLALSMMLGLVSCGGQPVGEETSPATSQTPVESNGVEADNHYPVTVETYDQNGEIVEQTFEACPERVVSISQANTELLIALGLIKLWRLPTASALFMNGWLMSTTPFPLLRSPAIPQKRLCWIRSQI